jgi:hypothetical protein
MFLEVKYGKLFWTYMSNISETKIPRELHGFRMKLLQLQELREIQRLWKDVSIVMVGYR